MSVKTILVALNEVDQSKKLIRAAAALGQRFQAHVIGMFVIPAAEIYPAVGMAVSTQVYEGHRQFSIAHCAEVNSKFDTEMQRQGVQAEWRQINSKSPFVADGVLHHAHQVDLVIAPQKQEKSSSGLEPDFTDRLIMESGRPILVMPTFGNFVEIGKEVLVAWNGTKEAARAVFDAMPLMAGSKNVSIAWVNPKKDLDDGETLPGTELAVTLARHNLNATTNALPTDGLSVSDALLNHANETGADLLVMGAYGHSRIREFVFGGATRSILDTMTLPVLMSR